MTKYCNSCDSNHSPVATTLMLVFAWVVGLLSLLSPGSGAGDSARLPAPEREVAGGGRRATNNNDSTASAAAAAATEAAAAFVSSWTERWVGCRTAYFWGGGKAGSTTLATYLKHPDPGDGRDAPSPFVRAGKEICWAEVGGQHVDALAAAGDGTVDQCQAYQQRGEQRLSESVFFRGSTLLLVVPHKTNNVAVRVFLDPLRRGGGAVGRFA